MLYVTTRDQRDAFTAHRTLSMEPRDHGGFYIPRQNIRFSEEEILTLKEKSFGKTVADILNLFFSARLDARDVEFCIGRYPVKLIPMSHRVLMAETWNNPEWDLARFVRNLRGRILATSDTDNAPTNWAWIAVRIAVLFGLFGELMRAGLADSNRKIDVSVSAGDFSGPMAVWYAREMGLPIGTIIYACNENSNAWELLNHGQLQPKGKVIPTATPLCDLAVPDNLERLLCGVFGTEEAVRFAESVKNGQLYTLTAEQRSAVNQGLFGAVVSGRRMESVIRNVYRTGTYLLSPYSALAYAGLQDYRATRSETGTVMILTEQGPMWAAETVSAALGISVEELKDRTHTM